MLFRFEPGLAGSLVAGLGSGFVSELHVVLHVGLDVGWVADGFICGFLFCPALGRRITDHRHSTKAAVLFNLHIHQFTKHDV